MLNYENRKNVISIKDEISGKKELIDCDILHIIANYEKRTISNDTKSNAFADDKDFEKFV